MRFTRKFFDKISIKNNLFVRIKFFFNLEHSLEQAIKHIITYNQKYDIKFIFIKEIQIRNNFIFSFLKI